MPEVVLHYRVTGFSGDLKSATGKLSIRIRFIIDRKNSIGGIFQKKFFRPAKHC